MSYPVPANEPSRIEALRRFRLLDTSPEPAFDDFVKLASIICETPIALVSLIDSHRQWFKARTGLDALETPREQAFCAHAILSDQLMIVPDATEDKRFVDNPLVTGNPHIRFYAGMPLTDGEGHGLGTLCVIDAKPRQLTDTQKEALAALGRRVTEQFSLRMAASDLANALENVKTLHGLLPICSYCKSIRDDKGYWSRLEKYLSEHGDADFSHGICPDCIKEHFPAVYERMAQEGKF